jgi:hypothetical protein
VSDVDQKRILRPSDKPRTRRIKLLVNTVRIDPFPVHLKNTEVEKPANNQGGAQLKEFPWETTSVDVAGRADEPEMGQRILIEIELLEGLLDEERVEVHRWALGLLLQIERKRCPFAHFAHHRDFAAMGFDDVLHDCQT